jgi:hypothetical protein
VRSRRPPLHRSGVRGPCIACSVSAFLLLCILCRPALLRVFRTGAGSATGSYASQPLLLASMSRSLATHGASGCTGIGTKRCLGASKGRPRQSSSLARPRNSLLLLLPTHQLLRLQHTRDQHQSFRVRCLPLRHSLVLEGTGTGTAVQHQAAPCITQATSPSCGLVWFASLLGLFTRLLCAVRLVFW